MNAFKSVLTIFLLLAGTLSFADSEIASNSLLWNRSGVRLTARQIDLALEKIYGRQITLTSKIRSTFTGYTGFMDSRADSYYINFRIVGDDGKSYSASCYIYIDGPRNSFEVYECDSDSAVIVGEKSIPLNSVSVYPRFN
jgi:hypothetical protein